MDIKLISFPDKVTGASDATGKIAADDVNQIKKILNAVVSALFPLDNTNTATSAVLKAGALPAVDIFTNNFSTDFVVSGGVIALSGLPQLPIAPPLINGVVDDDANTFTGTLPDGYAVTDLEATFNGGTSWQTITSLPLNVGDIAFAAGQVGLRIRATSERQHSATLYNATAFTSSAGNSDPDVGFSAVDTSGFQPNQAFKNNVTADPNTFNFYDAADGGNSYDSGSNVLSNQKIAAGTAAIVRYTINPLTYGFFFGLHPAQQDTGVGNNDMMVSTIWSKSSNTSGQLQFVEKITNTASVTYHSSGNLTDLTVSPRIQIRFTGTRIYVEYSLDSGNTWIDCAPSVNVPQLNQDVWIHMFGIGNSGQIVKAIQSGMVSSL